jgi:hypothetical protein
MDPGHPIFRSAVTRYVKEKGGYEFYAAGVDAARSCITQSGSIRLISKRDRKVLAEYGLDDIGLTAAEINQYLAAPGDREIDDSVAFEDGVSLSSMRLQELDARMKFGLVASAVLFAGALAPIARVPVIGTINYIRDGRGDGVIVLLIALVAAFLVARQRYSMLGHAGRAALAICFASLWHFQFLMADARKSMSDLGRSSYWIIWLGMGVGAAHFWFNLPNRLLSCVNCQG